MFGQWNPAYNYPDVKNIIQDIFFFLFQYYYKLETGLILFTFVNTSILLQLISLTALKLYLNLQHFIPNFFYEKIQVFYICLNFVCAISLTLGKDYALGDNLWLTVCVVCPHALSIKICNFSVLKSIWWLKG